MRAEASQRSEQERFMIPNNFEYHAPESLNAAIDLLGQYGDEAKVLSGGQSLIPVLKLRLAAPVAIIDIGRIRDLNYIRQDDGVLRIGALATHAAIAASDLVTKVAPLLSGTASQIGDQQVRNRGTIGGSLTHADPAADWPAPILALDAKVHLASKAGTREMDASAFFIDLLTTAIEPGEILTGISVPLPKSPSSSCYLKLPQAASGFAIVGVAVQAEIAGGSWKSVSVAVTGLSPKPYRAAALESALIGSAVSLDGIAAAAASADRDAVDAMDDIHASGEYRRHLARIYAKRALIKVAGLKADAA
jgi:carbon-monoxide dehydrogenase medium subunit